MTILINNETARYFVQVLCSKVIERIKLSFNSFNSSFTECVRNHSFNRISIYTQPITNDINPDCSQHTAEGKCKYTINSVTLSDGTDHTFTDSEFIRCQHDDWGGAIDLTNGGTLIIQRCIFDRCSCTQRGGAVSFRGNGKCTQEDVLYTNCSSSVAGGAFNSLLAGAYPTHHQKACIYIGSTSTYYAHFAVEYSPDVIIDSNIYIGGRATDAENRWVGAVANLHARDSIVYKNCLFLDGKGYGAGGLSFLDVYTLPEATLTVKFCFFHNNFGTDGTAREIFFDIYTSDNAREDLIIHSFSSTPNNKVYLRKYAKEYDWLPQVKFQYSTQIYNHSLER